MGLFGWGARKRREPGLDPLSAERAADRQLRRQLIVDAYANGNRFGLELAELLGGPGGRKVRGGSGGALPIEQQMFKMLIERGMQPPADPIDQLAKLYQLDDLQSHRRGGGRKSGEGGIFGEVLAAAAAFFAQSPMGQQMLNRQPQPQMQMQPELPTGSYAPGPYPAAPGGPLNPAPYSGVGVSSGAAGVPPQQGEQVPVPLNEFNPGQVLDHLEADEPHEFAAWLLGQRYGGELAAYLTSQNPDQLLAALSQSIQQPLANFHPFYHVAVWLVQHPDRAAAIVAALQQQMNMGVTGGNTTIYGTPLARPEQTASGM